MDKCRKLGQLLASTPTKTTDGAGGTPGRGNERTGGGGELPADRRAGSNRRPAGGGEQRASQRRRGATGGPQAAESNGRGSPGGGEQWASQSKPRALILSWVWLWLLSSKPLVAGTGGTSRRAGHWGVGSFSRSAGT